MKIVIPLTSQLYTSSSDNPQLTVVLPHVPTVFRTTNHLRPQDPAVDPLGDCLPCVCTKVQPKCIVHIHTSNCWISSTSTTIFLLHLPSWELFKVVTFNRFVYRWSFILICFMTTRRFTLFSKCTMARLHASYMNNFQWAMVWDFTLLCYYSCLNSLYKYIMKMYSIQCQGYCLG